MAERGDHAQLKWRASATIIPSLLVSGVLTISVSLVLLVWTTRFLIKKYGSLILLLLSVFLLLAGGGFGPPLLGLIAGVVATRINAPHSWWRSHLSRQAQHDLANLWPWSYTVCLVAWLMLFPGVLIIGYFFPPVEPGLIYTLILLAFGSLLATVVLSFAHDCCRQTAAQSAPALYW